MELPSFIPQALIVFMRFPEPGKVKSRLAEHIGAREAWSIYSKLVRRTLGVLCDFKRLHPKVRIFVFFTPPDKEAEIRRLYPGPWDFVSQKGGHLGERMERAFEHAWSRGCTRVVLVGSDIGDLAATDLEDAFDALHAGPAVLGPACDGGFYLIGLSRPCHAAFEPDAWGGDGVFRRTCDLLGKAGLSTCLVRERTDIDRPEDLRLLCEQPSFHAQLSVIVPTLSPPERLRPWIETIEAGLWPGDAITVVQGAPAAKNAEEQMGACTHWVAAPRGRGVQQNRGVQACRGDLLLFLHDDSMPPPCFAFSVRKILECSRASLGCFHLGFSPSSRALDGVAWWANVRTRLLKLPYGDQGLFCRREMFERAGGFQKRFLMEDVDLVRRMRRLGSLLILPDTLHTSPRRYLKQGVLNACLQNHLTMLLYRLGAEDRKLYTRYYKAR